MKHLKLDDATKELAGFVDLTPAEQMEEEEKREALLKDPTLLTISDPNAPMDVNLLIGGGTKGLRPKQDTRNPEKSVKLMNRRRGE